MSKDHVPHNKDPHYKKAKKQGYRARSAYKLFDIQKRFNIFKRVYYILDIGSTPGSWLQVSKKFAEENIIKYDTSSYYRDHYKIMGVDLKKLSPIENIHIIQMDVTIPEFQNSVNEYFNGEKLDLVISDASIKKSGNNFTDQVQQANLCFKILELARNSLKYRGIFVVKCFQGTDFDKFMISMKKSFRIVKSYKPQASNKKSNEIYLIGLMKVG